MSLDFETDTYFKNNFPSNKTLSIQNIESYYNYRTLDSDFKLVSSILSNADHFIELTLKSNNHNDINHQNYLVNQEVLATAKDKPVDFLNLRHKQDRINCAMHKIKANLSAKSLPVNSNFFEFFSLNNESTDEEMNYENNVSEPIPEFCRVKKKVKKGPCLDCKELCSLTMESILHPTNPIGQSDIYEELRIHLHLSSRKIKNGSMRRTDEAAEEFACHYVYAHGKKRPNFD